MTSNAFSATYADFKLVKTRGVVQLIFELPVEQSTAVLKILGGMPTPAEEKWFGIAPLDPKFVTGEVPEPSTFAAEVSARTSVSRRGEPVPLKQPWDAIAPSKQAGILCADPLFWKFIRERGIDVHDIESAANFVRGYCLVQSRGDLDGNADSSDIWRELVGKYRAWQLAPEYVA